MNPAIVCRKCQAGFSALYLKHEFLENGAHIGSIVCRVCGNRLAQREMAVVAPMREMNTEPTVKTEPVKNSARRLPAFTMVPCAVRGCKHTIAKEINLSGLCVAHGAIWRRWKSGKRTTPPPLIKKAGHYVENIQRKRGEP